MIRAFLLTLCLLPLAAQAQTRAGETRTILFVGNSFTQGAYSPVKRYRPETVTDLNRDGIGGVPALFKRFTDQAGQRWRVSLETEGGQSLAFHWEQRRARLAGKWDVVVLQDFSTLDRNRPGDPAQTMRYAPLLAEMAARANPEVEVLLTATWSRADLTYRAGSPWSGKSIFTMALELRQALDRVRAASRDIDGVIPVGQAWNRAFVTGVADPDPYNGTSFGQVDLWTYDQYHASTHGYYLEALVVFGRVTGIDPRTLGAKERAADDLGISEAQAVALQRIAYEQLAAEPRGR